MSDGNDYSFEAYLDWRDSVDYYRDDPYLPRLLKHFAGEHWKAAERSAKKTSAHASGRWNRCAETAAQPRYHPRLRHFDAHNRRIDRIERAVETSQMEREIFSLGLFSADTSHWQRLIQLFLIYQNGEASICCPLTCTEGLAAMLARFADNDPLRDIRRHIEEGDNGEFALGAQFLSEIQGGSDVNANRVEARAEGDDWRIYGKKFFCSVAQADYFLLSAKPRGAEQVAAFVVPAWLAGDKPRERRNGYRIERLKWKMGTCELPTAEIEFDGALAYPVGPLERGLANIVAIVLSCSRVTIGIFSAAVMTRAAREASAYARFRHAFGRPIAEFPMLAAQLARLGALARQSTAAVFRLARMIEQNDQPADPKDAQARRLAFDLRILIMLQKIVAASDSVDCLRDAISVFGGHGVIEDFSALPRLLRDAMVNELWEGPANVLLTQIHRDLQAVQDWYPAEEFVSRLLQREEPALANELSALLQRDFTTAGVGIEEDCDRWSALCKRLMHGFGEAALKELA